MPMNIARETIGVAPRGSTKVRMAESSTRSTRTTPSANHKTSLRTCMAQQHRRLRRFKVASLNRVLRGQVTQPRVLGGDRVGRSVVGGGAAAVLLAGRLAALGVEARFLGGSAR